MLFLIMIYRPEIFVRTPLYLPDDVIHYFNVICVRGIQRDSILVILYHM